jgi:tRNA-specific 2-thiouridylase
MSHIGKKVFVGLSGGVDSAVSAALLQRAGYDITGVFIKTWQPDWMECSWREDRLDAMRVAAHLDIPFVTLDLIDEYKKGVVDYMVAEYKAGRTPNPDVMCNREVKFGGFFMWAMGQGADFVATGHYAQVVEKEIHGKKVFELHAGDDLNKDQSYFLWTLTQKELSKTLFPVGTIEKPEVRRLAKKFRLPNAIKKDSQGLCFIGKIDFEDFLAHFIEKKPGKVLLASGEEVGIHEGAIFLTLGERHGFTITKRTPFDKPLYIVSKDVNKNTITVSEVKPETKNGDTVILEKTNWTAGTPQKGESLSVRTRYRQTLFTCVVQSVEQHNVVIRVTENSSDIATPGQSAVLYRGTLCLGGGVVL